MCDNSTSYFVASDCRDSGCVAHVPSSGKNRPIPGCAHFLLDLRQGGGAIYTARRISAKTFRKTYLVQEEEEEEQSFPEIFFKQETDSCPTLRTF